MSNKKMHCYTYKVIQGTTVCSKEKLKDLIEFLFDEKNNNVKTFKNGNKALIVDKLDDNYLSLDLLKSVYGKNIPECYRFFRIGRQKELEGALKRDKITFLGEPILDAKQQEKYELEICTYLLVDLDSGVILELYGQYAPSIKGFVSILNAFLLNNPPLNSTVVKYNNILTEKMVESFKNGGTKLGRIGYTYNIPDVGVLKYLGLDVKQIQALQELDIFQVDVTIKNKARIPLTKRKEVIGYTVNAFKECIKDIKDTLYFNGSTQNTNSTDYTFGQAEVTYTVDINNYKKENNLNIKFTLDEFAEQVYSKMNSRYEGNKSDILEYIN